MNRTAAIVIIGNEILSGKVEDENGPFLSRELRGLGVDVRRMVIISDDESAIAEEVASCSRRYDWVFTTGGIGPTHDDVTMVGIARGLGRKVIRYSELESIIRSKYSGVVNDAVLKLAEAPEGADLVSSSVLNFPVVTVQNIYIFPGIPRATQKFFGAIKDRFQDLPFFIRRIYLNVREDEIAADLHMVLKGFPHLLLGSYPVNDQPGVQVVLTLESKDAGYLDSAFRQLVELLPGNKIIKTE